MNNKTIIKKVMTTGSQSNCSSVGTPASCTNYDSFNYSQPYSSEGK